MGVLNKQVIRSNQTNYNEVIQSTQKTRVHNISDSEQSVNNNLKSHEVSQEPSISASDVNTSYVKRDFVGVNPASVKQNKDSVVSNDSEYLDDDKVNKERTTWSKVVSRNKQRITVGKNNDCAKGTTNIQGVPKMTSLHAYRFHPNTSVDNVVQFLKTYFPEVKCDKLQSRHPEEYSSFKVDIYEDNLEAALDPSKWPNNVCIRRFFHTKVKPPVG